MISLAFNPGPFDIELAPGITVTVEPMTSFSFLLAEARTKEKCRNLADSTNLCHEAGIIPEAQVIDLHDNIQSQVLYQTILGKELAQTHIRSWVGVLDAQDQPVGVAPETVNALLDIWPFSIIFQREIQEKQMGLLLAKKEYGVVPSGSSSPAAAPNTANNVGVMPLTAQSASQV